ncbi:hypothetical protein B0H14DRAFT_2568580 [Mycena olivaceomarginata]|nr:hypothetical protein B0H14DRAFT_2568580 [Mycena olivaceomarginata]
MDGNSVEHHRMPPFVGVKLWAFAVLCEAELRADGGPNGFTMTGQKLARALCARMQCDVATPGWCCTGGGTARGGAGVVVVVVVAGVIWLLRRRRTPSKCGSRVPWAVAKELSLPVGRGGSVVRTSMLFLPLVAGYLSVHAFAASTNITIDDANPQIQYQGSVVHCDETSCPTYDHQQLFNSTVTDIHDGGAALNFTGHFQLDGADVGSFATTGSGSDRYNVLVYQTDSLGAGQHTLNMTSSFLSFDYAVVTQVDSRADNTVYTSSPPATSTASTPSGSSSDARTTFPSGAKAAIAVGAFAVIAVIGGLLFVYRWRAATIRRSQANSPDQRAARRRWSDSSKRCRRNGNIQRTGCPFGGSAGTSDGPKRWRLISRHDGCTVFAVNNEARAPFPDLLLLRTAVNEDIYDSVVKRGLAHHPQEWFVDGATRNYGSSLAYYMMSSVTGGEIGQTSYFRAAGKGRRR